MSFSYRLYSTLLFFGICLLCQDQSFAQIVHTKDFTTSLEKLGLLYYEPTETWYHVLPLQNDEFFQYSLVIEDETENLEIRYIFQPDKNNIVGDYPRVKLIQFLTSASSNMIEHDIRVNMLDTTQLKIVNADWGAIADFVPKAQMSDKSFARLLALHKEGKANVYVMYLFNHLTDELEKRQLALKFK